MIRYLISLAIVVASAGIAHAQAGGFFFPGYGNTYGLYSYGPGYNYGVNGRMVYGPSYNSLYNLRSGPTRFVRPGASPMYYQPIVDDRATIQVIVPTPDAEIVLGSSKTTSTGTQRVFYTDPLEPGFRYSYAVTATWLLDGQPKTETRTIDVAPGRMTLVDFAR